MIFVCSPSYSEGWGKRIAWAQEFETSLGNIARPNLKNQNKVWGSWLQWYFISLVMQGSKFKSQYFQKKLIKNLKIWK
jgi:hypothetical protein